VPDAGSEEAACGHSGCRCVGGRRCCLLGVDGVGGAADEDGQFLIQLVVYYLWLEAGKEDWELDQSSVQRAITAAQRRNTLVVVESALSDISYKDREFLDAMAEQDGRSAAGQIGSILKAKPDVVSKYRRRLIAAGLIESAGYGRVDFAILGLRQYLRD
jgi:hypothetical protein